VYDIFDSESALELNPEVIKLTPGTPCMKAVMMRTYTLPTTSDVLAPQT
jgi:hypothetical protein